MSHYLKSKTKTNVVVVLFCLLEECFFFLSFCCCFLWVFFGFFLFGFLIWVLYEISVCFRQPMGARCSSVVRAFAHGAMGHRIDPSWGLELFLVPASAP